MAKELILKQSLALIPVAGEKSDMGAGNLISGSSRASGIGFCLC